MRLALDIGGTFIKCACVNENGDILTTHRFTTDTVLDSASFAEHLVNGVRGFIDDSGETYKLVGAGMAGFSDGSAGIVYESPNLPDIHEFHLADILSEGLDIPAFIENDATAAAWGEYLFGGHKNADNMLVVTLGTGIGGGLVLNGKIYRGTGGMAGEIGQMIYEPDGAPCGGGGYGCLESFCGKFGLMETYRSLANLPEPVEPDVIFNSALKGDKAAKEAYIKYGHQLGVVFASSANLLNPDAIILTGGIIGAWEFFGTSMADSFRRHVINPLKDTLHVELTTLSGNAGILGAAFLDRDF